MTGYRRFIAYVYEYRKGKKQGNCGFIKVEVRGKVCVVEIHLHVEGLAAGDECKVYGFVRKEGLMNGILIGSCRTKKDWIECLMETDGMSIGGSGVPLEKMGGMILITQAGGFYGTEWDDQAIRPENFKEAAIASEKSEPLRAKREESEPEGLTEKSLASRAAQSSQESLSSRAAQNSSESLASHAVQPPHEDLASHAAQVSHKNLVSHDNQALRENLEPRGTEASYDAQDLRASMISGTILPQHNIKTLQENLSSQETAINLAENSPSPDSEQLLVLTEVSQTQSESEPEPPIEKESILASHNPPEPTSEPVSNQEKVILPPQKEKAAADHQEGQSSTPQPLRIQSTLSREACGTSITLPFGQPFCPFTDGDLHQCWKITPQDLVHFPRRQCALRNNRFLQYGYYNFGHLLLCRRQNGRYILGVPGCYDQQEQFMAGMFGFSCFKESSQIKVKKGKGGYWYRAIDPPVCR